VDARFDPRDEVSLAQVVRREHPVTYAYGAAYHFDYDNTPDGDFLDVAPGEQQEAWAAWATSRGLRWWYSTELAPASLSRWIAGVASRFEGCTHVVVMEADHLLYDPSEGGATTRTEVREQDVRNARFLLPVDHPLWAPDAPEISYWPITAANNKTTTG
jgi:hypothetical protein